MHKLINLITAISKLCLAIILWILLFVASIEAVTWLATENYQITDVPNEKFKVLVVNAKGDHEAVNWQTAKSTAIANIVTKKSASHAEDFLKPLENGSLLYHNEGALWHTESIYRIQNNKLIPISFIFFTFVHVIYAMIIATALFTLGKYAVRRWQLRHSLEETKTYNQAVLKSLKKFSMWTGLIVGFYITASFLG